LAAIPDETRELLVALADEGEKVWQEVAVVTMQLLGEPGAVKMRIYSDVGACLGMKSAGVRSWVGTYQAVGDDLLAEFPQFRYSHWRILVPAARKSGKSIAELAMAWAVTADAHNGMPVPPDKLAAALALPKGEKDPLIAGLERAGAALVSAMRYATKAQEAELQAMADRLQAMAEKAASQTKEAANAA
jgi:hypothetical protein